MLKITLRELEVFVAIGQSGQLTLAGSRLGLSQSATSGALAELERRLGVALFDRIGRRVVLNAHGRHLLPRAIDLLTQVSELETSYVVGAASRLTVAASLTIGNYVLPPLLAELMHQNKQDQFEVKIENSQSVVDRLLACDADIGLIESPITDSQLVSECWLKDEMVVFARADHPFIKQVPDHLALAQAPWVVRERGSGVRQTLENLLLPYLGHFNIALELGSGEAIREVIRHGAGISCASKRAITRELQSGEFAAITLPNLTLERQFYIVWHKERQLSAGGKRFREACHSWLGK